MGMKFDGLYFFFLITQLLHFPVTVEMDVSTTTTTITLSQSHTPSRNHTQTTPLITPSASRFPSLTIPTIPPTIPGMVTNHIAQTPPAPTIPLAHTFHMRRRVKLWGT